MTAQIDPVDLTLECSGDGWVGTFGLAVTFVVEDILSDGAPFPARITYLSEDYSTLVVREVEILAVREHCLEVREPGTDQVSLIPIDEGFRKLEA